MGNVEFWIKLLHTYGPFALLVFFVFVTERKARTAMKEASAEDQAKIPLIAVYLVNWLIIFGLVGYAMFAWHQVNLHSEPRIHGRFVHRLSATMENRLGILAFPSDKRLYLNPDYGPGVLFDYDWLLITPSPLAEGTEVPFKFDRKICTSEWTTTHVLHIRSSFYTNGVSLEYDRDEDTLILTHGGTEQVLLARGGSRGGGAP